MKQLLLISALVGCGESAEDKAAKAKAAAAEAKAIETAIRRVLNKPTGELTKTDLEKVTVLNLESKSTDRRYGSGEAHEVKEAGSQTQPRPHQGTDY